MPDPAKDQYQVPEGVETFPARICECGAVHDRPEAGCPQCGSVIARKAGEALHVSDLRAAWEDEAVEPVEQRLREATHRVCAPALAAARERWEAEQREEVERLKQERVREEARAEHAERAIERARKELAEQRERLLGKGLEAAQLALQEIACPRPERYARVAVESAIQAAQEVGE